VLGLPRELHDGRGEAQSREGEEQRSLEKAEEEASVGAKAKSAQIAQEEEEEVEEAAKGFSGPSLGPPAQGAWWEEARCEGEGHVHQRLRGDYSSLLAWVISRPFRWPIYG